MLTVRLTFLALRSMEARRTGALSSHMMAHLAVLAIAMVDAVQSKKSGWTSFQKKKLNKHEIYG
ncbi:hypothetical protein SKAU_G00081790, partial [Synaphobranchus kaupii]